MASPRLRARTGWVVLALAAVLATLGLTGCGEDATAEASPPEVTQARSPVPANPGVAAVYLEIGDPGPADDLLVAARTDAADRVELHESVVGDDGTVRMEEQRDGIAIPAGQGVTLAPGGLHLMLLDPRPFAAGDTFELSLEFADGGERTVEVTVTADVQHTPDHDEETDEGHG